MIQSLHQGRGIRLAILGSKDRITRREFFKMFRQKDDGIPFIAKDKCTGCGLCGTNCPTGALTTSEANAEGTYRISFFVDLCNVCRVCEKSCPEKCLTLTRAPKGNNNGKEWITIFKDKLSCCSGCGNPLFPEAMVNRLKSKMSIPGGLNEPFDLCPFCRIKTQFEKETDRNIA